MKVLVTAQSYPDNNGYVQLMYIHTRNLYYVENGIEVTVLNFSAKNGYIKDGISVISYDEYKKQDVEYDLLVLHAANVRSHFRFIKKYGDRFKRFIFFYHGHEVMKINYDYSRPYDYMKSNKIKYCLQNIYDDYKLNIWRRYLPTVLDKSCFVFVSEWMKDVFIKNVKINVTQLEGKYSIIYNSVGKAFEDGVYSESVKKEYDFITIRSNLNDSKYAVDIVNEIAKKTPKGRFLVVGKGELFDHIEKAPNLIWMNRTMNHSEIIEMLNKSRYALMPTRTDAQGLMMCEMAAFGIPVITSDISVCHEVFDGFLNVHFIDNTRVNSLIQYLTETTQCIKDDRYYFHKTIMKEIEIIKGARIC